MAPAGTITETRMVPRLIVAASPDLPAPAHHHCVAQVHTFPALPAMHTQPSVFPPSTASVQTPLVPLPEHGIVQAPLLTVPAAQADGVAEGW
jgi:hypothetical protein